MNETVLIGFADDYCFICKKPVIRASHYLPQHTLLSELRYCVELPDWTLIRASCVTCQCDICGYEDHKDTIGGHTDIGPGCWSYYFIRDGNYYCNRCSCTQNNRYWRPIRYNAEQKQWIYMIPEKFNPTQLAFNYIAYDIEIEKQLQQRWQLT